MNTDKPRVVDNPDLTVPIDCDNCSEGRHSCCNPDCPTAADLVNKVIEERAKSTAKEAEQPPAPKYKVGDWVKRINTATVEFCIVNKQYYVTGWQYSDGNTWYWEDKLESAPEQTFKVGDKIVAPNGDVYMFCATIVNSVQTTLIHMGGIFRGCRLNTEVMPEFPTIQQVKDYVKDNSWLTKGRFTRAE